MCVLSSNQYPCLAICEDFGTLIVLLTTSRKW